MRRELTMIMVLLAAVPVAWQSCLPDPVAGKRFQCSGIGDSSCGDGCACVASGKQEPAFWCQCGGVSAPTDPGSSSDYAGPDETTSPPDQTTTIDGCVPACDGRQCGDDGCGGTCGKCSGPQDECIEGVCVCQPNCVGKQCGDDGCKGSCGTCTGGKNCQADKCV